MKATLNKKLHERALAIIEMIENAQKRIKVQEDNINRNKGHLFFNIERSCQRKIESMEAVIDRLEKSYIETLYRINKAI
jgi:hypothetical protein